jgi:thiol-disulfide isomerase/thioredoxin
MRIKMNKIVILILLLLPITYGQKVNQVVIDEKSDKAMLVGETTLEAFSDSSFAWWWNSEYKMYETDSLVVSEIASKLGEVEMLVIMGTWCSDSRREVPRFFKVLEESGYDVSRVRIINVDREKKDPEGLAEAYPVDFVPTFYFYRNESEIGAIVETPQESLEADLLGIVK